MLAQTNLLIGLHRCGNHKIRRRTNASIAITIYPAHLLSQKTQSLSSRMILRRIIVNPAKSPPNESIDARSNSFLLTNFQSRMT